jgi:L-lactate utilization protein LutB
MLNDNKESFITEAGDIEEWRGGVVDKTKIIENIQEYIRKLKDISEA